MDTIRVKLSKNVPTLVESGADGVFIQSEDGSSFRWVKAAVAPNMAFGHKHREISISSSAKIWLWSEFSDAYVIVT